MRGQPRKTGAKSWRVAIALLMIPVFLFSACTTSQPEHNNLPGLSPQADQKLHRITARISVKASNAEQTEPGQGEVALAREKVDGDGFNAIKTISYVNHSLVSFDLPEGRYHLVAIGEAACKGLVLEVPPQASKSLYAGSLLAIVDEQEMGGKVQTNIRLDVVNDFESEFDRPHDSLNAGRSEIELALFQEVVPAPSCSAEGDTAATVVGKIVVGVLVTAGIIVLLGLFILLGIGAGLNTN